MPSIQPDRLAVLLCTALLVSCAPDAPTGPAISSTASLSAAGAGAGPCLPFRASGTTFAQNAYTFAGTATLWIGDSGPLEAEVTTYLTGTIKQGNPLQGAQVVTTSHVFDLGGGDLFVTEDIARMVPTGTPGVLKLISTLRIVEGYGAFAGVPANPNPRFGGSQTSVMDLTGMPPVATLSFDAKI